MLTFEQKLEILESFPELTRKNVSLGRVNFQYEQSVYDKKNVVYHLHPNGNGYVYGERLLGYPMDDKGFVNIRDFTEAELRIIVEKAIRSLSAATDKLVGSQQPRPLNASGADSIADRVASASDDRVDEASRADAASEAVIAPHGAEKPHAAEAGIALEGTADAEPSDYPDGGQWIDEAGHTLVLVWAEEEELWFVYAGDAIDMAFETRGEAAAYLREEGFRPL
ncbi:hypothetical protein [Paenibacillus sp. SYP-B4298]|uniref:hypothetical protein n=1 Tax=Paenibacillus sp. SYP-B4298 TaxID=2996034 RepID=UPI003FA7978D